MTQDEVKVLARKIAADSNAEFKDEVNARAQIIRACGGVYSYCEAVELLDAVDMPEAREYVMLHYPMWLHYDQPENRRLYTRTLANTVLMLQAIEAYCELNGE